MTALADRPTTYVEPDQVDARTHARRERLVKVLGYAAMLCVLVIVGLPLYWIVMTSFKVRPDIYTLPTTWWPPHSHPQNYSEAVQLRSRSRVPPRTR